MHVPFSAVLTVVTLALSCVPAVLIWTIFSRLMDDATGLLYAATTDGITAVAGSVQDLLLVNSLNVLNARLTAGNKEHLSQLALLNATGLLHLDLHPNATDLIAQVFNRIPAYNFPILKNNDMLNYMAMEGTFFDDSNSSGKTAYWMVWQVLNIDVVKAQMGLYPYGKTLYLAAAFLSKDELWNTMQIWYVDQTTGAPLVRLSSDMYPWQQLGYGTPEYRDSYGHDLYVSPYSGQVVLTFVHNLQFNNKQYAIGFGLNSQSMSDELRAQLDEPTDRLFLFFRQPHGHLLAASHGKYFSRSDVDQRYTNPLVNPPNLSQYVFYTCFNSTDALIAEGCRKMYAPYGDWTLIPESRQETVLEGRNYWVAIGYSNPSLESTMVLLKDRQYVMGTIDANTARVVQDTNDKRGTAALVFGIATAVAATLPLLTGLWLGHRLLRLAEGMDSIAQLDFRRSSLPQGVFREMLDVQKSFLQMERGLQAFGQFVPSAVVTRLVAGKIQTDDQMENALITVMFVDIQDFSTLAETLLPAQLAEVCTEYFEVMCKHVVSCEGTVDKFIGDCVMALWNAPLPRPGHERSAVTAALRMQAEVLAMHDGWQQRDLPALKFRLGLHTGNCLVGNFGCSHRVSYTCFGASVNLASRLEALNKKFGTALCVSEATYAQCEGYFRFRHLSKVTVPGCSDVLAVYEVLCAADAASDPGRGLEEEGGPPLPAPQPSGGAADGRPRPRRPLLGALCSDPVGAGRGPAADAAAGTPQVAMHYRPGIMGGVPAASPTTAATDIPYHWGWRCREMVLKEAAEYEWAYTALTEGRYAACRRVVTGRPLLDKSWQALAAQLELLQESSQPWDGVLHFSEK